MNDRQRLYVANTLSLLLVIALGLQCAWWFWQIAGRPSGSSEVPAIADTAGAIDPGVARQLFGGSGNATVAAESDIKLKGVYAADGRTLSEAVVNLGGRDQVVLLGKNISDKVSLAEVHADHIVISRAGARETIPLEKFRNGAGSAGRGNSSPAAGFRLNVASIGAQTYSLSRQELNNVLQDPRQLEFTGRVGAAPGGGVRIDDAPANSLPAKLGLRAGDIITAVNGQNIGSPGDLLRFYQQFGTLNSIRVEIRRAGAPSFLSYSIQP